MVLIILTGGEEEAAGKEKPQGTPRLAPGTGAG